MKTLITGGLGYIGSATALRLRELGHEILVVDDARDSVASPFLFKGELGRDEGGRVASYPIDHPALASILVAYRPDVVFHFAASTSVRQGEKDPTGYANNNIGAFARFLDLFRPDLPIRIVHASSAAVYAPMSVTIPECAPLGPSSFYGHTKLMAEKMLEAMATEQKLRFVGLRYFNVVGRMYGIVERRKREDHLIPRLLEAGQAHGTFTVNGGDFRTPDGTAVRDYVHIEDVVRANIRAAECLLGDVTGSRDQTNEFINIGSGVGTSVFEVLDVFAKLGQRVKRVMGARRHGDPAKLVAEVGKAKDILGWVPERTLEDAVRGVAC